MSDRTITLRNPADDSVLQEVPLATVHDVDQAVVRAQAALPAWRDMAPNDRIKIMRRFAETIAAHAQELAELDTRNMGMPIGSSKWCADTAAEVIHYYAGAIDKHLGHTYPVAGGVTMTFHEPLGVVGLIVPWNFPVLIACWKLGPALACGNTVILKPAETTPLSAMRLGELALEAGIPEGVLQVVVGTGPEAGWRLVEHPMVRKIGFTGSTAVGKRIMAGGAEHLKRVTLELGGKSANIVFADADIETVAASAPGAVFDNSGQDCCSRSRIFVQRPIFDEFVELMIAETKKIVVGDPMDSATTMGPLFTQAHHDRVSSYLEGVTPTWTGSAPTGNGYWFPCTIIATSDIASRVCTEEIFGPIATIIPFTDESVVLKIANDTEYGLAAFVFTNDLNRALRVSEALEFGMVGVNEWYPVTAEAPFGGMKQSGMGRESGVEGVHEYVEARTRYFGGVG
jgi:acyl-CoA reductase-like NAD-dependent aldehyde dehydrogenase